MHSTVINSFSYIFIAINEYVAELQFCRLCTLTDATDVIFQQTITFACLYKLLSWAKVKKQSLMSSAGNTGGLPSDLTGIVHACIQKIHTFGASGRSVSALQLKVPLSAFCSLNRSVTRALSSGIANCCLLAQCLYVSSSSSLQCKTATERKRSSRENSKLRQSQQLLDTIRRKSRRQEDVEYRQTEQSRNRGRQKTCRQQDVEYRQEEQS